MRIASFFLLSLVCSSASKAQTQASFVFPFDTSSRWEYEITYNFDPWHPGHAWLRFTKDTLLLNGRTYRILSNGSRALFYFRQDSTRIYQFNARDTTEFIRYDFAKKPGDTLSTTLKPSSSGFVVLVYDHLTQVLNESRRTLSFQSTDGIVWDDIADTIGVVNFNPGGTDVWYSLTGAMVNGRTYGVLTDVPGRAPRGPTCLSLLQNYPNPFNPTTTISFTLPASIKVRLSVYDLLGAKVEDLIDGELTAGSHSIQWDAADRASGVYFYTLWTPEFSDTKCMVLLK